MTTDRRRLAALPLAAAVLVSATAAALAQDEASDDAARTTISAIERGEVAGAAYLEGAALAQLDDAAYLFSDGSGVITIAVEPTAAEVELPLFELLGIVGGIDDGRIEVDSWEQLRLVVPAVIVPEAEVIDAFWNWIVAYGSQAPAE